MTAQRKIFWLRLATLIGLCLPALYLAWRWTFDELGPRAVVEATHITGDWTVVFLLASLAMTPARGIFDWMMAIHIRRRIGVAAALYALLHFAIYVADQKWNLIVVALEIIKRFYLTIGFVALLALVALAVTSTDGWQKRLRRNWKRLHWLIYPAAVLAVLHFFIQSKANVGEAAVAAGLFAWLMIWRVMPDRLRKTYPGLALLAAGATLVTVVFEVAWYGLVNHIDPLRILAANIDPDLAPRPAHKVLAAALAVIVLVLARRSFRTWRSGVVRAASLSAVVCLAMAQARESNGQSAGDAATPRITQTVRVYDATLIYPAPMWVKSQNDAVNGSEVFREQKGNSFVLEQIRKTETFNNWTELLKVTALQTPDAQKIGMTAAIARSNAGYLRACGQDNVGQHVFHQDATSAVFGVFCGNTPRGPTAIGYGDGVGEISVTRLFIVKNTLVMVQYAWRRPKFDHANQATYPVPTPTILRAVDLLDTAQAVAN
ncbi:MAG: sulfite oxidase heme-binding subunit YedZ [Reyranellales bacterium]